METSVYVVNSRRLRRGGDAEEDSQSRLVHQETTSPPHEDVAAPFPSTTDPQGANHYDHYALTDDDHMEEPFVQQPSHDQGDVEVSSTEETCVVFDVNSSTSNAFRAVGTEVDSMANVALVKSPRQESSHHDDVEVPGWVLLEGAEEPDEVSAPVLQCGETPSDETESAQPAGPLEQTPVQGDDQPTAGPDAPDVERTMPEAADHAGGCQLNKDKENDQDDRQAAADASGDQQFVLSQNVAGEAERPQDETAQRDHSSSNQAPRHHSDVEFPSSWMRILIACALVAVASLIGAPTYRPLPPVLYVYPSSCELYCEIFFNGGRKGEPQRCNATLKFDPTWPDGVYTVKCFVPSGEEGPSSTSRVHVSESNVTKKDGKVDPPSVDTGATNVRIVSVENDEPAFGGETTIYRSTGTEGGDPKESITRKNDANGSVTVPLLPGTLTAVTPAGTVPVVVPPRAPVNLTSYGGDSPADATNNTNTNNATSLEPPPLEVVAMKNCSHFSNAVRPTEAHDKIAICGDHSGSMDDGNRMEVLRSSFIMLNQRHPNGTVKFYAWNDGVEAGPTDRGSNLTNWIQGLHADGGTEMLNMIDFVAKDFPGVRDIYIMTDGEVSVLNSEWEEFIKPSPYNEIRFHFIALGSEANHAQLSRFAAVGRGNFTSMSA